MYRLSSKEEKNPTKRDLKNTHNTKEKHMKRTDRTKLKIKVKIETKFEKYGNY